MKVEKVSTNTYRVRKTYKGKRYDLYFDHKPTDREVTIALAEQYDDNSTGLKGTFEKYAKEYIENRSSVLSPASIRTYNIKLSQLSEDFRKKNIASITNEDVQIEVNDFAGTHSPKTTKTLHGFIVSVLGAYRPNLRLRTKLPQAIKKDEYEPSSDDIKRILEDVKGTRYSVPFQLGVLGMRRGEISAADISDLKDNELWIHRSKVYIDSQWVVKESPKTDASNRKIYLPDSLVSEIYEQGCIFDGHPNALNKAIHRVQDKLGIPQFKFHMLRSYFASYAHSLGISDADILSLGGWATDNVMKNVYRKSLEESRAKSVQKIIESLF